MSERAAATKTALEPVPAKTGDPKGMFEEFDQVFDAIGRRAFEIFEGNGSSFGHELEHWLKAESEFLHPVKVNMTESREALAIQAEVPGFTAKDLEVQIEGQRLTIGGERESSQEQRKGKTVYQEHRLDKILRVIDLPTEVDASKATAALKNGMLELQVPKSAKAKSTRVEVKIA